MFGHVGSTEPRPTGEEEIIADTLDTRPSFDRPPSLFAKVCGALDKRLSGSSAHESASSVADQNNRVRAWQGNAWPPILFRAVTIVVARPTVSRPVSRGRSSLATEFHPPSSFQCRKIHLCSNNTALIGARPWRFRKSSTYVASKSGETISGTSLLHQSGSFFHDENARARIVADREKSGARRLSENQVIMVSGTKTRRFDPHRATHPEMHSEPVVARN